MSDAMNAADKALASINKAMQGCYDLLEMLDVTKPKKEECSECKFYSCQYCRRYPPENSNTGPVFPRVEYNNWCGEFVRKEQP